MLFSVGCFSEAATHFKSYWKHCYLEAMYINWTKRQSKEEQISENYYGASV